MSKKLKRPGPPKKPVDETVEYYTVTMPNKGADVKYLTRECLFEGKSEVFQRCIAYCARLHRSGELKPEQLNPDFEERRFRKKDKVAEQLEK